MNQAMTIRYDPRLIEEAVFHAQRDSYVARDLDEARNRIYEIPDADERERLFDELNRSWFVRLGLGKTIEQALQEQTIISSLVGCCFIVRATQAKQEGAELFVLPDAPAEGQPQRTLRILLRPESLLDTKSLMSFLRHELFHIADMLDPAFAYEPTLPNAEDGPIYDMLITNRYRVLWEVTISGRMARRGWLAASQRGRQFNDFQLAFPMLEVNAEECFARFFDVDQPKHAELAAFAFDPRAVTGDLGRQTSAGSRCALCKFPTHSFELEPDNLGTDVLAAISRDFPHWTPAKGLCGQCADLYRAAQLSLAAAKQLPGWNVAWSTE